MWEFPSASGRTLPMVMTSRRLFLFEVAGSIAVTDRDVGNLPEPLDEQFSTSVDRRVKRLLLRVNCFHILFFYERSSIEQMVHTADVLPDTRRV